MLHRYTSLMTYMGSVLTMRRSSRVQWTAFVFMLFVSLTGTQAFAQTRWLSPVSGGEAYISGRGWQDELSTSYYRLPDRFRSQVRQSLWNLSMNASGLYVDFFTSAADITVKYTVMEPKSLNNVGMMAKSGVDLYRRNGDGWLFCSCFGSFDFGSQVTDTIVYHYRALSTPSGGATYRLYLPLYNTVSSLKIGVPEDDTFRFVSPDTRAPIVVYGTSIVQGASASRPGMSWVNQVQRSLDIPVYNLGFSGNGCLDDALFHAMGEVTNARLFIIDCMPNMDSPDRADSIAPRLECGVRWLHAKSSAPILLVEHDGYSNETTQMGLSAKVSNANAKLRQAYNSLVAKGVTGLHYMTKAELGLCRDDECQVDGVHATDLGMRLYAQAYLQKIRQLLHLSLIEE
ncbi:MAG: SGNH/GDSL hydrolase family protein [Hallella multisaccharivorax]